MSGTADIATVIEQMVEALESYDLAIRRSGIGYSQLPAAKRLEAREALAAGRALLAQLQPREVKP